MNRRSRLAWGLVGALSFLVLVQGYELVVDVRIGFTVKGIVALVVGVSTVVLTPPVERRLSANGRA